MKCLVSHVLGLSDIPVVPSTCLDLLYFFKWYWQSLFIFNFFFASCFIKSQTFVTVSLQWLCSVLEPNLEWTGGMLLTQQSHEKIILGLCAAAVTRTVHTEMHANLIDPFPPSFLPSFSGLHAGLSQQGHWPKMHGGLHAKCLNFIWC